MAVNFTNNWKNILDKLESVIETEFKGALPVFKGDPVPKGVNQALQLIPVSSALSDYNTTSETREFSIQIRFGGSTDSSAANVSGTADEWEIEVAGWQEEVDNSAINSVRMTRR